MKRLYVRVVKSEYITYWYSGSIGEVFKVTGFQENDSAFLVRYNGKDTGQWIDWSDCKPATKEEYKAQNGG